MPVLRVSGFDGVVPRNSATMLSQNQAQVASNVKLYARELRYWRGPTLDYTPALASVQTIYKLYGAAGAYIWLTWDTAVSVAPGPLADTADFRIYYTGQGTPRKTNYALASTSTPYPADYYEMGVPAPTNAPSVTRTGIATSPKFTLTVRSEVRANDSGTGAGSQNISSNTPASASSAVISGSSPSWTLTAADGVGVSEDGALSNTVQPVNITLTTTNNAAGSDHITVTSTAADLETRAYVYTYVSTFGSVQEESGPSPASELVDVAFGEAITLGAFSAAPTSHYNITSMRLYRTVTGASTDTYQFVAEFPIATTSYVDVLSTAELGETLGTIGWDPPPAALSNIVALPNGSLAGFVGNTVYFSEPFFPHAWPSAYAITLNHTIVGLGVFGSSLVACTQRFPYIISGSAPGAMSVEQVPLTEPCLGANTIASDQNGVVYASPNGLVSIGPGGSSVSTDALFRRDEWQAISPAYLNAAIYDNKFFGVYGSTLSSNPALVLSRDDIPALSYLTMGARCVYVDNRAGTFYILNDSDNKIYSIDSDSLNPYTYTWTSKRFVLPQAVSFSALKLDSDYSAIASGDAYIAAYNAAVAANLVLFSSPLLGDVNASCVDDYDVNGSLLQNLPISAANRSVTLQIYGDGYLQSTMTVTTFDPIRIPSFRAREVYFTLTGNIPVRSLTLATTTQELATADA